MKVKEWTFANCLKDKAKEAYWAILWKSRARICAGQGRVILLSCS